MLVVALAASMFYGVYLYVRAYQNNPNSKEHIKIGMAYLCGVFAGLLTMFLYGLISEII